ncbi:hypothetical protein [Priestia aryabhattai]
MSQEEVAEQLSVSV